MTEFTLKITQMDRLAEVEGKSDVVVRAHWAYIGTSGDKSGAFGGSTDFPLNADAPFTPYESLTEADVAKWVTDSWTVTLRQSYESYINHQIGVVSEPPPWTAPDPVGPVDPQP